MKRLAGYALLCLLFFSGCQTAPMPGNTSGALAQVKVNGSNPEKVFATVEQVFEGAGFRLASSTPDLLVFERAGTQMDAVKYGDWDGTKIMMRAKVSAEGRGAEMVLQCRVAAVRNYRESLETEVLVWRGYQREYQSLMNQVRDRLASP